MPNVDDVDVNTYPSGHGSVEAKAIKLDARAAEARTRLALTLPLRNVPRSDMIRLLRSPHTEIAVVFELLIAATPVNFLHLVAAIPQAVQMLCRSS